jgi:hypothetical protein
MYNADISGQDLVQSPGYRIHYHYHTTTTAPKYNLLYASPASYEEAPTNMAKERKEKKKCASLFCGCTSTNALILPARKIKLQHKLSD